MTLRQLGLPPALAQNWKNLSSKLTNSTINYMDVIIKVLSSYSSMNMA